ncbi:MAG TPA: hypothetical protein VNZ43_03890, partial [Sphingomonadaceae bacterium]|nr:hypothetical protein [Sphingomonadaceae bacterium]
MFALPVLAVPPIGMIAFGSHIAAQKQAPPVHAAARNQTCDIGTNLAGISYWSTEFAFLDRFKTTVKDGWMAWAPGNVMVHPRTDSHGNPLAMPEGVSAIQIGVQMDPVDLPMTDRYVLTYEGKGSFSLASATIVKQSKGRIVFDFKGDGEKKPVGFLLVSLTSIDGKDPVRNIHIVREDREELFNAGKIFEPAFLKRSRNWGALRFMDWGGTNGSQVVHWSDRAQVADASYSNADGGKGVPIEVMVA